VEEHVASIPIQVVRPIGAYESVTTQAPAGIGGAVRLAAEPDLAWHSSIGQMLFLQSVRDDRS
jgi:hypothetical protein